MAKMKKAVLISLGMLLLGAAVLSFSAIVAENSRKESSLSAETAVFDRLWLVQNSIGRSIAEIVRVSAGIDIGVSEGSVSFSEQLPNPNYIRFQQDIDSLRDFAGNTSGYASIDSNELKENLSFVIEPQNITYSHNPFGGNEINVDAGSGFIGFEGYIIKIDADETVFSCVWSSEPGNLSITVEVDGANSTGCSESRSISPASENSLRITALGGDIILNITQSSLKLAAEVNITSNITILSENSSVSTKDAVVSASFPRLELEYNGRVTIFE